jgi:anti-anti-sigma factor
MSIEQWSSTVRVVRLGEDPAFSDVLQALERLHAQQANHIVLDFATVGFVSSSNLARLLKLRKAVNGSESTLILCGLNNQVWGTFLATGLDAIFRFSESVHTALASLQIEQS